MLSRKWKPLRNYVRRVAEKAGAKEKSGWKEKNEDFEKFGWKPEPLLRETSRYDDRTPRYKLVDMPENWSPYKWSGINRPANKNDYIALPLKVDAMMNDLVGFQFMNKMQKENFRSAARKFEQYWKHRRIARAPLNEDQAEKKYNEAFLATQIGPKVCSNTMKIDS